MRLSVNHFIRDVIDFANKCFRSIKSHQYLMSMPNVNIIFNCSILMMLKDGGNLIKYPLISLHRSFRCLKLIEAEWCIFASINQVSICSDNGLLPIWHQAIIWINSGLLLIGPAGTNLSGISIKIQQYSHKKMNFKILSCKISAVMSWPNHLDGDLN